MDKFNEPEYQPDPEVIEPEVIAIDVHVFLDHCMDLYDAIKYCKRKERKRAAQELVLLAVSMKDAFVEADHKLSLQDALIRVLEGREGAQEGIEGAQAAPTADVPAAPSNLDPDGKPATGEPNCWDVYYKEGSREHL